MSDIGISRREDWEGLAQGFEIYGELIGTTTVNYSGMSGRSSYTKGSLTKFKDLSESLIKCAEKNDYGHYFSDLKLTQTDLDKIKGLSAGMARLCRTMHHTLMQNVDNQVMRGIENIFEVTSRINEGDNVYTYGTREESILNTNYQGYTYETKKTVKNDLKYYVENGDTSLGELYDLYEVEYIRNLEMYKPEGYKDAIEGLKGSKNTLYIATIGVYNKKLDEGDIRNYLNEIFIGVAVVAAIVVVIATGGVGAIVGALGLQALTGASAVIATGIVGIGYGAAVGLGVGAATGMVGYFVNTSFGDGNYAMDGTYMTEDTKANMFDQYVSSCAKAGMMAGAAAGASAAWIVETAWDAGDMLKAIFSGDKIGIFVGFVSLLFSGDDIIKGVKYMDEAGDAGKNIGKSLDGDILTDGSHLNLSKRGKGIGLKPDVTYKTGEFGDHIYKTDDIGRIKEVNVDDLKLSEAERAKHNANTPGKDKGDHAGHLIADRFGGSPELDNLVSQLDSLNLSAYKKMENDWANVLKNGGTVTDIKIKINYDGDGLRPTSFDVKYEINGKPKTETFDNIRK